MVGRENRINDPKLEDSCLSLPFLILSAGVGRCRAEAKRERAIDTEPEIGLCGQVIRLVGDARAKEERPRHIDQVLMSRIHRPSTHPASDRVFDSRGIAMGG